MAEEKSTEYPKVLYKEGWVNLENHVVVNSVEEEEEATKGGFKHLSTFTKKAAKADADK